jgi:hypothetical protein
MSPALVANSFGRVPLRSVTRSSLRFVTLGADHARGFELDELLQHGADRLADHVNAVAGAERVQQLRQGRLGQGHRWISFSVSLGRFTPKIPPMAAYFTQPRR